jgi:hypothetical protein
MSQHTDKIDGNWRAIVTDNNDPFDSGRVKIDIPSLRLKNLWAEPAISIGGGGGGNHGGYVIPRVGDKLFVFFDGGNNAHPIYFAMSPSQTDIPNAFAGKVDPVVAARNSQALKTSKFNEPTTNATVQYPYGQGTKFPGGVLIVVDESNEQSKVAMYHPANSYTEYAGDGSHVGRIATDDYEIIMGDLFTYVGGSITGLVMDNIDLQVTGNYTEKVLGNVTEQVGGNVTEQIAGNVMENVIGNVNVNVAQLISIIANAVTVQVRTSFNLIAPSIMFEAATSISMEAPLINILGGMVLIGQGIAPVLTVATAFCPWCGGSVGPGVPTVLAG